MARPTNTSRCRRPPRTTSGPASSPSKDGSGSTRRGPCGTRPFSRDARRAISSWGTSSACHTVSGYTGPMTGCVVQSHSLAFNGTTDQYVTVPTSPAYDIGAGEFTIEGWIRVNPTGTVRYPTFLSRRPAGNQFVGYFFGVSHGLGIHGADDRVRRAEPLARIQWHDRPIRHGADVPRVRHRGRRVHHRRMDPGQPDGDRAVPDLSLATPGGQSVRGVLLRSVTRSRDTRGR